MLTIILRLTPCVKCGWEIYKSAWTGLAVCTKCDYNGTYLKRWIYDRKSRWQKDLEANWENYEERVARGVFYPKTLLEQLFGPRGRPGHSSLGTPPNQALGRCR